MKTKKAPKTTSDQHLADDLINENGYDDKDLEELDDKIVPARSKQSGNRRTDPTAHSQKETEMIDMLKCPWKDCKMQLESQGLLLSHMREHSPNYT